jgi:hypothetical protein
MVVIFGWGGDNLLRAKKLSQKIGQIEFMNKKAALRNFERRLKNSRCLEKSNLD